MQSAKCIRALNLLDVHRGQKRYRTEIVGYNVVDL